MCHDDEVAPNELRWKNDGDTLVTWASVLRAHASSQAEDWKSTVTDDAETAFSALESAWREFWVNTYVEADPASVYEREDVALPQRDLDFLAYFQMEAASIAKTIIARADELVDLCMTDSEWQDSLLHREGLSKLACKASKHLQLLDLAARLSANEANQGRSQIAEHALASVWRLMDFLVTTPRNATTRTVDYKTANLVKKKAARIKAILSPHRETFEDNYAQLVTRGQSDTSRASLVSQAFDLYESGKYTPEEWFLFGAGVRAFEIDINREKKIGSNLQSALSDLSTQDEVFQFFKTWSFVPGDGGQVESTGSRHSQRVSNQPATSGREPVHSAWSKQAVYNAEVARNERAAIDSMTSGSVAGESTRPKRKKRREGKK